jgi:hypothetical protein
MLVGLPLVCNKTSHAGIVVMDTVKIERIGGLGGFGGPHLKSYGERDLGELSIADRNALQALFANQGKKPSLMHNKQMRDGFNYRISRQTESGHETIEVPEDMVPAALISCIKDVIE